MEILVELVDDAVLLERPWQNEGDKAADLGAAIKEPDRQIGVLAKGGLPIVPYTREPKASAS